MTHNGYNKTMGYYGMFSNLFIWWYGRGIADLFAFLQNLLVYLYHFFSVGGIFKTLFSPWKKMVAKRRPGVDGLKDWITDNVVSRLVGFLLRAAVLFFFFVTLFAYAIFALVAVVFWIVMPLAVLLSFINIFSVFWGEA